MEYRAQNQVENVKFANMKMPVLAYHVEPKLI